MKLNTTKTRPLVSTTYTFEASKENINVTTSMSGDIREVDFNDGYWEPVDTVIELVEIQQCTINKQKTLVETAGCTIGIDTMIMARDDGSIEVKLRTTPTGAAPDVILRVEHYEYLDVLTDDLCEVVADIILAATDKFIATRISDPWAVRSNLPIPGSPTPLVGWDRKTFREKAIGDEGIKTFCEYTAIAVFTIINTAKGLL